LGVDLTIGALVGFRSVVGFFVGLADGFLVGRLVGFDEGFLVGRADGFLVGRLDGFDEGFLVGRADGFLVGRLDGFTEGLTAVMEYWHCRI
jgi:hypothetical protein